MSTVLWNADGLHNEPSRSPHYFECYGVRWEPVPGQDEYAIKRSFAVLTEVVRERFQIHPITEKEDPR